MRFEKLPMRALSDGCSASTNRSAACSTSVKLARMLTLRSSSITTVMGWTSFANSVSVCGLPLSRTLNASRGRSGSRRPSGPVTVAYTATVRMAALNVASCPAPSVAPAARSAMAIEANRVLTLTPDLPAYASFHRQQRGLRLDAVPEMAEPDVLVRAVLTVVVVRDRHRNGLDG